MQISPGPTASTSRAGVIVPPVIDLREATDHIGVKKNLFGFNTGKIFPDRNVAAWLRERLKAELRAAEVNTIRKRGNESAVVVQLILLRFFSEPMIRLGPDEYQTTLAVRLKVTSVGGDIADREYVAIGLATGQRPKEKNYTPSVEHATAELMKRLLPEIIRSL